METSSDNLGSSQFWWKSMPILFYPLSCFFTLMDKMADRQGDRNKTPWDEEEGTKLLASSFQVLCTGYPSFFVWSIGIWEEAEICSRQCSGHFWLRCLSWSMTYAMKFKWSGRRAIWINTIAGHVTLPINQCVSQCAFVRRRLTIKSFLPSCMYINFLKTNPRF